MKNLYKAALLAALGIGAASAVQAQTVQSSYTAGDLLVGLYQSGVNTTTVVDIGSASSLANGQSWNLSSFAAAAGITSASDFGIIGDVIAGGTTGDTLYSTGGGLNYTAFKHNSNFNGVAADISTIGNNQGTQLISGGNGFDWFSETLVAGSGVYLSDSGVQANMAPGTAETLYSSVIGGSGSTTTSAYQFNFDAATDVLTYGTVSAVPEPGVYGLLAGAGLLIVSLRKQFGHNQA
jgi:hypothetical protein